MDYTKVHNLRLYAKAMRRNLTVRYRRNYYKTMEKERAPVINLQNLLEALPDIVYILDTNGHFLYLNAAVRWLGWEPGELLGKHFSEIVAEDDRARVSRDSVLAQIRSQAAFPAVPPKLFDERRSGERMTRDLEVRLVHRDTGEISYGLVNAYGEFEMNGPLGLDNSQVTLGIIHDNTMAHLYQKSLEANLEAKELQLRETHHRVKDNLQVIASLLHLREMETTDSRTKSTLAELIAQIKAMSMVHDTLSQTERTQGVDVRDYFGRFCALMEQTYGYIGCPVSLFTDVEGCMMDGEQLSSMAIIANELVSNAYKHAFPNGRKGEIHFEFFCDDDYYYMAVSDNGIGINTKKTGLGHEIVAALTARMDGQVKVSQEGGTRIEVRIPLLQDQQVANTESLSKTEIRK
ncbi:MAG: histidine kinase dimerization/phosphoacceptor domain -containing protein [Rectinema sp.]